MKSYITLIFVFLLNIFVVSATETISDSLFEGQTETYTLEDVNYEIYVAYIGKPYQKEPETKFSIDGNLTPKLYETDIHISGNVKLLIDDIDYVDAPGYVHSVTFTLSTVNNQCGNNICEEGETCSSCTEDCGCQSGYVCQSEQCVEEIICGDGKCSSGETCEEDNCCNGNNYYLNSDNNNCGTCGNSCYANQLCTSGICVNQTEYCGDSICNLNENCGTCIQDCTCTNNTQCESNQCVTYCGNGICEPNEEDICNKDCQWCGDNSCNNNETYETCSQDCERPIVCGDDICDSNENCCVDCGCDTGYECVDNSCVLAYECTTDSDCKTNETCANNECVLVEQPIGEKEASTSTLTRSELSATNDTEEKPKAENKTAQILSTKEQNVFQRVVDWFLRLFR